MRTPRSKLSTLGVLLGLVGAAPGCSNVAGSVPGDDAGACSTAPGSDAGDEAASSGSCKPGDSDGITGGCDAFDLSVDDIAFSPIILKTQNLAQVTLTLKNSGTRPHDFTVECLATPNSLGCPPQSCFPAAASVAAVPPGGSATTTFVTPNPEGIYVFRSDVPGDSAIDVDGGVSGLWGQFVIQ